MFGAHVERRSQTETNPVMSEVKWAAKRSLLVWIIAAVIVLLIAVVAQRTGWVDWARLR